MQVKNAGVNVEDLMEKLDKNLANLGDEVIKIVLMGSFSDGKTTTIAGLLGKLEENMKIDVDESSDELTVYRPDGLKKGFEIVDTPGLFGDKYKEIDGKKVRFSQITEKYISEAHIIIYVTQASVPMKESHVPIISRVLRDFGKIDSTIFVLNRMDDNCDMADDDDFARVEKIKKEFLINRLKDSMQLTFDEEKRLNIVCIAANPYGEGLEKWFKKPQEYKQMSKIEDLRHKIDQTVQKADVSKLQIQTHKSVIKDLAQCAGGRINDIENEVSKLCNNLQDKQTMAKEDLASVKKELLNNKRMMRESLETLRQATVQEIKSASSMEAFSSVLESSIGMEDKVGGKKNEKEITCFVLESNIDSIIEQYTETNKSKIEQTIASLEENFGHQQQYINGFLKTGALGLSKVTVSNAMVKNVRNIVAPTFKFKPWGAVKLAGKITKVFKGAAVALTAVLEALTIWKKHKENKKLDELKSKLCGGINSLFKELYESIADEQEYYKKFAPSFPELQRNVEVRDGEIDRLKEQFSILKSNREKLAKYV
ncbi:MAG: dynamin family protein [Bacteroidales bacterium]|nr:dynamin family protein [Bacteroidales bacterium]